jgi:hypothetical protein
MIQHHFLKNAFIGNAVFSFLSGLVMIILNDSLSLYIGISIAYLLPIIGINLIVFSICLWFISRYTKIRDYIAWTIVLLDLAWVLGSAVVASIDVLTVQGNMVVMLLAAIVFLLSVFQLIGIRKSKSL